MRTSPVQTRHNAIPTQIPMLIGGQWLAASETYEVRDSYRGGVVAYAPRTTSAELDAALQAAVGAKAMAATTPAYERAALLRRAGTLLLERADAIAEIMARETGKAIKDAKAEIVRSQDTLSLSAEEAVRIEGEHVPLDASAMGAGKICFMLRFPVGVVAAITPFNAPCNLACHTIAPAIAAGNTLVLKAPPQAPGVVHELARIFVDAGTPKGVLNVLYGDRAGPELVRDPRVDFITFTGTSRAGAEIKAASGLKRVALELGGNGATIVHHDAGLAGAASVCARNAMRLAGQSCISVQTVKVASRCRPSMCIVTSMTPSCRWWLPRLTSSRLAIHSTRRRTPAPSSTSAPPCGSRHGSRKPNGMAPVY
jgi:acyl-CoA reductase-like NAD-dependent aldehyde dehydrogenase